ncbi:hypothetical protein [Streptomyces sp. NPDC020917]|uniref:hypothetical protein n=1 Tax=Streptomyces sp. NPDC020917 TaxID=3365102 RepID=UPI0037B4801D
MRRRIHSMLGAASLTLLAAVGIVAPSPIAHAAPPSPITHATPGRTYYIATNGSDANPGTIGAPFKTLEHARDAIRALKARSGLPSGGVTVYLRGGRYTRTSTFALSAADKGTASAPITYSGYPGETVYLDGGKTISPSDVRPVTDQSVLARVVEPAARPHLEQIDLTRRGIRDFGEYGPRGFNRAYTPSPLELFIDGRPQTIARYPNVGQPDIPVGKVVSAGSIPRNGDYAMNKPTFGYSDTRVDKWAQATDAYASGTFHHSYADDSIRIDKIDTTAKTITLAIPHMYGVAQGSESKWHAVNLLEEIDVPGEYYVDKETGKLYLYPPYDLSASLIQVSMLKDPLVSMIDTDHTRFAHMVFENSRGMGAYMEGGTDNYLNGVTLRNLGQVGLMVGQGTVPLAEGQYGGDAFTADGSPQPASDTIGDWNTRIYRYAAWNRNGGTDNGIKNSDIYNTGEGGVILGGGDRKSLTPAGNFVDDCDIFQVTRLDKSYKAAVNIDGVGNRITHSLLHDVAGQAIYLHGNDHTIEYNQIYDALQGMNENGAIYMGRDPSEVGNKIQFNFFHHIVRTLLESSPSYPQAISFDDKSGFNSVSQNYFFQTNGDPQVIGFNGGGNTSAPNNIAIDTTHLVQNSTSTAYSAMHNDPLISTRVNTSDPADFRGVSVSTEPYKTAYPYLASLYTSNVNPGNKTWNNQVVTGNYSDFVDPTHMDFTVKSTSPMMSQTATGVDDPVQGLSNATVPFQAPPFAQMGLQTNPDRGSLLPQPATPSVEPKVGTVFFDGFENGTSNWTSGAGLPVPSGQRSHSGKSAFVTDDNRDYIYRDFGAGTHKKVSMWFFDNGSKTVQAMGRVDNGPASDGTTSRSLGVSTSSAGFYVYRIGTTITPTTVPRTNGWHEFMWDYTSGTKLDMYIDGTLVVSDPSITSFTTVAMGNWWSGAGLYYFDDVDVYDDSAVVENFEHGLGAWTVDKGTPSTTTAPLSRGLSYTTSGRTSVISRSFPGQNKVATVEFYDNAADRDLQTMARADATPWSDPTGWRGIGVNTRVSPTKYVIRVGTASMATTVTRTTGWHKLEWDYSSGTHLDMYIDGVLVTPSGGVAGVTGFHQIALGNWQAGGRSGTTYFDDVTVE